jgi:hypothetical protein
MVTLEDSYVQCHTFLFTFTLTELSPYNTAVLKKPTDAKLVTKFPFSFILFIVCIAALCHRKAHRSVHKNQQLDPVLNQINHVHIMSDLKPTVSQPFTLRSILILSSHVCIFLSDFPTKDLYPFLISYERASCVVHLVLLDLITVTYVIWWRVQTM